MGDFPLVLNLKSFEVDPQDHIHEVHLSPLSSVPLREYPDCKLVTLGGKVQGYRLKLLFLLTDLKGKSCHGCAQNGSLSHLVWKPKSWNDLCRSWVL